VIRREVVDQSEQRVRYALRRCRVEDDEHPCVSRGASRRCCLHAVGAGTGQRLHGEIVVADVADEPHLSPRPGTRCKKPLLARRRLAQHHEGA
jgi:hypothetical protein